MPRRRYKWKRKQAIHEVNAAAANICRQHEGEESANGVLPAASLRPSSSKSTSDVSRDHLDHTLRIEKEALISELVNMDSHDPVLMKTLSDDDAVAVDRTVFVDNVPPSSEHLKDPEKWLRDVFIRFGHIYYVHLLKQCQRCAFIRFRDPSAATAAVAAYKSTPAHARPTSSNEHHESSSKSTPTVSESALTSTSSPVVQMDVATTSTFTDVVIVKAPSTEHSINRSTTSVPPVQTDISSSSVTEAANSEDAICAESAMAEAAMGPSPKSDLQNCKIGAAPSEMVKPNCEAQNGAIPVEDSLPSSVDESPPIANGPVCNGGETNRVETVPCVNTVKEVPPALNDPSTEAPMATDKPCNTGAGLKRQREDTVSSSSSEQQQQPISEPPAKRSRVVQTDKVNPAEGNRPPFMSSSSVSTIDDACQTMRKRKHRCRNRHRALSKQLAVYSYADWKCLKEKYKAEQKASFSALKTRLKDICVPKPSELPADSPPKTDRKKRGRDKIIEKLSAARAAGMMDTDASDVGPHN